MEKEKMDLNFTKETVASIKTTVEELEKKEMEEQLKTEDEEVVRLRSERRS
jgi:hypothetical protein